jgi:hypothetical protein
MQLRHKKIPRRTSSVTPVWVLFGIRQRQSAAPGSTEHLPPIDTQMLPQAFHVRDEVPGGVVGQARMRCALPQPR